MELGETVIVNTGRVGGKMRVGVAWACAVGAARESVGWRAGIWAGVIRLQAERISTSTRDGDRNLNVFNFSFVIAMKNHSV